VCIKDTHRILQLRRNALELEKRHNLQIEDLLPILSTVTADLRGAIAQAAQAAKDSLVKINTQRYKRRLESFTIHKTSRLARLDSIQDEGIEVATALAHLESSLNEYHETRHRLILDPFSNFLDTPYETDIHDRPPFSLRPLFMSFVFQSNLLWTSDSLVSLLKVIQQAEKERPRSRLWVPKGLSKEWSLFSRNSNEEKEPLGGDIPPSDPALPAADDKEDFGEEFRMYTFAPTHVTVYSKI